MDSQRALRFVLVHAVLLRVALCAFHLVQGGSGWSAAFHRFDSGWYERIAVSGYPEVDSPEQLGWQDSSGVHQSEWAFFPLYPMLARVVAGSTGMAMPWAMELLSWPLALGALLAFAALARRLLAGREAAFALLAYACFPFSVFLHVHYTEALFVLLLCAAFVSLHDERWWLAALLFALIVLVRPNGLLVLPAALQFMMKRTGMRWPDARSALVFLPAAVAFAGYCAYQYDRTGEPFAFSMAQAGWGRGLSWPWEAFFRSGDAATQIESLYTLFLIATLLWLRRRFTAADHLLIWVTVLVPLCSGSVDSMTRFTLVLFPLFLVAGAGLARTPPPWRIALGVAVLAAQLLCCWLWAQGHLLMA